MPMSQQEFDDLVGGTPTEKSIIVGDAYEGANRFNRETALWSPPMQSADMDILPAMDEARARANDMNRNDAYVQSGGYLHRDNIVGAIFLLNAKPNVKVLDDRRFDEKWQEEFQAEVESKFTLYAESMDNWIDASRRNTLTSLVRLAVGVYVVTGEILASVEWLRDVGRPYQTAIQMIDVDRLSNPDNQMNTKRLRGGVRMNKFGAPLGYYIRVSHPRDIYIDSEPWRWRFVAARKPWGRPQMIHIMEQMRVDQTRGIADMVAALKELRATKRFRDITLQNAVVNATYAATIESELPSEAVFASLGAVDPAQQITEYAASYLGAIAEYAGAGKNLRLDGVKIPHLFPGTKFNLRNAGTPGGVGTEFESSLLRYIAANLGTSYEQLSRDYTKTNYSAIKAAGADTWKFMQSRKKMGADRLATNIYALWLEEAINAGEITSMPRNAPNFYEGLNKAAYCACDWIGAGRGQIDELKETQASVLRLKHHLSTYEEEHSRLGKDWRQVLAQREREAAEMKARGLEVEQANSINAASGAPRESEESDV